MLYQEIGTTAQVEVRALLLITEETDLGAPMVHHHLQEAAEHIEEVLPQVEVRRYLVHLEEVLEIINLLDEPLLEVVITEDLQVQEVLETIEVGQVEEVIEVLAVVLEVIEALVVAEAVVEASVEVLAVAEVLVQFGLHPEAVEEVLEPRVLHQEVAEDNKISHFFI